MEPSSYGQQPEFSTYPYRHMRRNSFMIISLIMGLLAVLTCYTLVGGLIFGALGILFAILSKGSDSGLTGTARGGLAASVVGLLFTFAIYGFAFYIILTPGELHNEFNKVFEQQYGVTIEDLLDGKLPENFTPYSIDDSDHGNTL